MVQKKSLISNLKASKKAVLASKTSTPIQASKTANLSKNVGLSKHVGTGTVTTGFEGCLSKSATLSKAPHGGSPLVMPN